MESFELKISSRESGSLLQNKTFVPLDGPFLSVTNSSAYKTISFVRATWNKSGTKIAACDCHGNTYVLNFPKNRFSLAHRFNTCCSFMIFVTESEILVALTDCNILLLNLEFKSIKNCFNYHSSCVKCISFDKSGHNVLSASKDEAILWDLSTFKILRILSLKRTVDIVQVFFVPDKDLIVSAFKDSTVFLWDFQDFSCDSQFICDDEGVMMNTKTIDCSWDGELIACAGKVNWFIIWSISEKKRLHTVVLSQNVTVKQISFFPFLTESSRTEDSYVLTLLTSESDICIYSVKNMELLHSIKRSENKIISYSNSKVNFHLVTLTLQGNLDVYDLEPILLGDVKDRFYQPVSTNVPHIPADTTKSLKQPAKVKKKKSGVDRKSLKVMLKNFEEYPEKYRFFIWSQLLSLPHNIDAFKVLHQESLHVSQFVKDYSFMNPGVQKTFLRLMAMLACWFPVIREVEYFQCVVFPFVKVLHKNTIMCFETLVTYITSWCQNWFLFCPFPPINILCVIENILFYHDEELVGHFIKHNISPEMYAWSLLQSSFSEVFNKHQWLKLWDNIFSNPLSFLLFAVAAFNIIMRDVLLQCKTVDQFKQCYQKHGISASVLIKKTHELLENSPNEINPNPVIGKFTAIPKGAYPSFMQMLEMDVDLQTHFRKSLIDTEIEYMTERANFIELKGNYLLELQKLQLMRRKMFLENMDIQDTEALAALARKLKNIQNLIQGNLIDQIAMLRGSIDNKFCSGSEDYRSDFFKFKNYMKKVKDGVN